LVIKHLGSGWWNPGR